MTSKKVEENKGKRNGIPSLLKKQLAYLHTKRDELTLEGLLNASGLIEGKEYSLLQGDLRRDGSRALPDVIINFPDGKKMIVDSSVPLKDYERFVTAEDGLKDQFLRDHFNGLKRHIDQLSKKKYEDLYDIERPDFVLMFVPIETAFETALKYDSGFYNKAFDQNIIIVTPTTLLATLRTMYSIWDNDYQERNDRKKIVHPGRDLDDYNLERSDLQELIAAEPIGTSVYAAEPERILASVSYDWNDDARSLALVRLIREGMDYHTFETVAAQTPLKDKDWALVLDTTLRTLVRYKKDNKTFAPKQTEKIVEIQQLMHYGEEVFGAMDSFHSWLMMDNVAMGGVSPKELLDTSVGLGIVKDALGRIEHGILA
ncbi:DNA recombination protein RmuC [Arenibacter sp. GZD96]|uniref:DNA recombination protein RmuC n=1 Tax=Aurantibrevibacter litoralis TaxID=3106030 RepID=UPI002AFF63D8|nr:DNA recombination protein RmuC [Arenibacter sp. GZD-96]MEA1786378.1 DNA recombination protein RmuC [Arenibacter sp. GZD-96]